MYLKRNQVQTDKETIGYVAVMAASQWHALQWLTLQWRKQEITIEDKERGAFLWEATTVERNSAHFRWSQREVALGCVSWKVTWGDREAANWNATARRAKLNITPAEGEAIHACIPWSITGELMTHLRYCIEWVASVQSSPPGTSQERWSQSWRQPWEQTARWPLKHFSHLTFWWWWHCSTCNQLES